MQRTTVRSMSFIAILFGAYGITREKREDVLSGGIEPAAVGDICEGKDKDACERRLLGGQTQEDADFQAGRFLALHLDLLKRTQADATRSKYQMFAALIKALPTWAMITFAVVFVTLFILRIIPNFIIMYSLMVENRPALGKVLAMVTFTGFVLAVYFLFPV